MVTAFVTWPLLSLIMSSLASEDIKQNELNLAPHSESNVKVGLIAAHLSAEISLMVTVQRYVKLPPPPTPEREGGWRERGRMD